MSGDRRSVRLKDYDYSQNGAYYITICTYNRSETLSSIRRGDPCGRPDNETDIYDGIVIEYTQLGLCCKRSLCSVEDKFSIIIDSYIIMPDHIHLIIFINRDDNISHVSDGDRATARVAPTIGLIVGAYKSIVSNEWLKTCKSKGICMGVIWQRNYFEHVIRNKNELDEIRGYISLNPIKLLQKRGEMN